MDWQDPDFLELRKKWYDKLAAEGFEDIEHIDWETGESGNLLDGITTGQLVRREAKALVGEYRAPAGPDSHRAVTQRPGTFVEEHARYYQLCEHWKLQLEEEGWPQWYKKVWALHTDGARYSVIGKKMGVPRGYISKWIRFQEQRMLHLNPDGTPKRDHSTHSANGANTECCREVFMPVKAVKRGEKFRVVEAKTGRIAKRKGQAIDGGGHKSRKRAQSQARAVNANT